MGAQEWLVERFRALCNASGGVDAVADKTGLSADYLKQIYKPGRTKLQVSKNARGLGPGALRALDEHYPDWFLGGPDDERAAASPLAQSLADQIGAIPDAMRAGAVAAVSAMLATMAAASLHTPSQGPYGKRRGNGR